jgi:enoyl-CoA hydratase/carnithine racemase
MSATPNAPAARYEDVLYEVRDRIAVVTLNRPDRLNAWTSAMNGSVRAAIGAAAEDTGVRAIVLTGAGRGFCAGADMGLLQDIGGESGEARARRARAENPQGELPNPSGIDVASHYRQRYGFFFATPKPIIAAINGPCAGLGLVVSLYCDLRFAARDAKFTTSFAQRGLIAEHGVSWLLPRLVGSAHALDLLLSARKFDGVEAERIGLVNRAFPGESLMDETMAYARALADTVSPRSMAVMKAQLWASPFQDFNTAIALADAEMAKSFGTEDFREGVAHFVEKRAPRFTGR